MVPMLTVTDTVLGVGGGGDKEDLKITHLESL